MARFIKGDIVVIPFPFSDLSGSKRRPAFVINTLPGNDILLCQITSKSNKDRYSISITSTDFTNGTLPVDSYIRPNKLFTADKSIIIRKAGTLKNYTRKMVIDAVVEIVTS